MVSARSLLSRWDDSVTLTVYRPIGLGGEFLRMRCRDLGPQERLAQVELGRLVEPQAFLAGESAEPVVLQERLA